MQTPTTETPSIEQLYEEQIRSLTPEQKLRLIALIASELAVEARALSLPRRRSLMELEGLGAEIWQGIDTQEYVDQLRSEWDEQAPVPYGFNTGLALPEQRRGAVL